MWADLRLLIRYVPAKLFKLAQRVTCQVGFGLLMVIGSHFLPDAAERDWVRESGGAIAAWAVVRWYSQQHGQRRTKPETGVQVRHPTLRMTPKEAERIQALLRK